MGVVNMEGGCLGPEGWRVSLGLPLPCVLDQQARAWTIWW